MPRLGFVLLVCWACISSVATPGAQSPVPGSTPASPSSSTLSLDVVVLDRDGRPVDALGVSDFTVTIDGNPRTLTGVRQVSRGPGASEAAALIAARGTAVTSAAEAARTVLLVVDETLMERGDETPTIRAATSLLDRLGLSDRVAVVRVPMHARGSIALTTDRPAARDDLRAVVGQIAMARSAETEMRANEAVRPDTDPSRSATAGGDPEKAAGTERELAPQQMASAGQPGGGLNGESIAAIRDSLGGLHDLLVSLRAIPGRKAVLWFSAGLPRGWSDVVRQADLRSIAAAASAARATIHAFGLKSTRADTSVVADPGAFDTLARMTGGSYAAIDKQVDRAIDRLSSSMSHCYVLSWQAADNDVDGRAHTVRVETSRKGATLQVSSVMVKSDDPDDAVVALPATVTGAGIATNAGPRAATSTGERVSATAEARAERERMLSLVLSRAADYVAGYQQAFSAVVAEETYAQTVGNRRTTLVSDFLLVRPPNSTTWVSFRDVFLVDGERVRDRDDRLKALFLEHPDVDASEQLRAIKTESARYNIGPVERTLNVPLYALRVLMPEARGRFRYRLGKTAETDGLPVQRIEFEEVARPTLVCDSLTRADVPLSGSFTIDPLTGAILESELEAHNPALTGRFVVRYRRDTTLGLWVPREMIESYASRTGSRLIEAQASYARLRRFLVKTEEKLTLPK